VTVVVTWTGPSWDSEHAPKAAVWKKRATARDVAKAEAWAAEQENGKVHQVVGRFELATFRKVVAS